MAMPEHSTEPYLVTLEPVTVAAIRETVPMSALTGFFDRVFRATMATAQQQGIPVVGPPVAVYYQMPSDTVDVAGGFPTASPVEPDGDVHPVDLPGGQAAQVMHVGSYDSLEQTYGRLMAWMREQQHTPAEVMWEAYLNEPDPDRPDEAQTLIVWPLAG